MAISVIGNSLGTQALDRPLAFNVETNRGDMSTAECGDLVATLFPHWIRGAVGGRTATARDTSCAQRFMPLFKGFDSSDAERVPGSLKDYAFDVLQSYDPRDPNAMKDAFVVLSGLRPGEYELDAQDNLMLTGTAEGYIGARPFNRESDWNDRTQDWSWDCMEYNVVHPGPNGEGLGPVRK